MVKKNKTRMYCSKEFKTFIDIKRLEYGDKDIVSFTEKVSKNPDILKGGVKVEKKTKFRQPRLF